MAGEIRDELILKEWFRNSPPWLYQLYCWWKHNPCDDVYHGEHGYGIFYMTAELVKELGNPDELLGQYAVLTWMDSYSDDTIIWEGESRRHSNLARYELMPDAEALCRFLLDHPFSGVFTDAAS